MSGRADGRAMAAKVKEEALRVQGARAERGDAAAGHCGVGVAKRKKEHMLMWRSGVCCWRKPINLRLYSPQSPIALHLLVMSPILEIIGEVESMED